METAGTHRAWRPDQNEIQTRSEVSLGSRYRALDAQDRGESHPTRSCTVEGGETSVRATSRCQAPPLGALLRRTFRRNDRGGLLGFGRAASASGDETRAQAS